MPSTYDVARRANVAVNTVSYALSGTRRVSPETTARIRAAMDDLGSRPNALAPDDGSPDNCFPDNRFPDVIY